MDVISIVVIIIIILLFASLKIVKEYDQIYTQVNLPRMVELYVESRDKISQANASQFSKEEQPVLFNLLFILNRVSDISTMLIGIHETTRHKPVS